MKQYIIVVMFTLISLISCVNTEGEKVTTDTRRKSIVKKMENQVVLEYREMIKERRGVDGSGYLYMSTKAYKNMLNYCSDDELEDFHLRFRPQVPFKKLKSRSDFRTQD